MSYQATQHWGDLYRNHAMAHPAEGVIRIFKGSFPGLSMPTDFAGKSILDLGCGDGRHFPLFLSLDMIASGVEISDTICNNLRQKLQKLDINIDIRTGTAAAIPFASNTFDWLLTWNSCYYMSANHQTFEDHVAEMARVIRPGGWIVCSLPKKTAFIFQNSIPAQPGYRTITDDYFGLRNGEVMRCMANRDDVEESFSTHFDTFCHADIDMDWFGLAYHWHVFCAKKATT